MPMNIKIPSKEKRQSIWIKLGIAALLIRFFFSWQPYWCEHIYARGMYPWIRSFFDHTVGFLPFAGIYIFGTVLGLWILIKIVLLIQNRGTFSIKVYGKAIFSFLMGLIFWFLFLWGYNYARIPIAEQIGLDIPEAMNFEQVWQEAQYIKQQCIQTRLQIPNIDSHALDYEDYPNHLEQEMRLLLEEVLEQYAYDCSGEVRGRFIAPKGILLRFNSSGVYFPFTGEGHVDDGLHIISKPFTMAHELAHGYGFGSEATCNFLGFLACIQSKNPAIQYSGYLMYWRYVYGSLMEFMTEENYQKERATISRGMYNDLEAIYAQQDSYAPFLPFLQPAIYDVFLKVQGVEDGIKSYDRMVLLVSSWRQQHQTN